jgi:hypothetical protein
MNLLKFREMRLRESLGYDPLFEEKKMVNMKTFRDMLVGIPDDAEVLLSVFDADHGDLDDEYMMDADIGRVSYDPKTNTVYIVEAD